MEEWRDVPGWEGRYEVSDEGRIRSARTKKIRFTWEIAGYRYVRLYVGRAGTNRRIHRLVCAAFNGPAPVGYEVNHINGIRDDNRIANLEWVTKSQNCRHKRTLGRAQEGSRHPRAKFTEAQVIEMRSRAAGGEKYPSIARSYDTTPQAVCLIVNRKLWRHI